MSDLIDRQDAIELVKEVCDAIMRGCESWYDPEIEDEVYTDIREVDAILKCNKEVRIALRNMPSAQERKKGKWIDEPVYRQTMDGKTWDGYTYCSECREMYEYGYRSKCCPNCGADMRGED